jgi:hypothetical protein
VHRYIVACCSSTPSSSTLHPTLLHVRLVPWGCTPHATCSSDHMFCLARQALGGSAAGAATMRADIASLVAAGAEQSPQSQVQCATEVAELQRRLEASEARGAALQQRLDQKVGLSLSDHVDRSPVRGGIVGWELVGGEVGPAQLYYRV